MTTEANLHQISIVVNKPEIQLNTHEKINEEVTIHDLMFSESVKRSGRFIILLVCIAFLVVGRYSVPDNELDNIKDLVMDSLKFANDFINREGNQIYRDIFQGSCSFMVDIVFLITFGYWVLRGTNARLPISLGLFYGTRAIVQKLWFSPFPEGFYWDSPGIPSLVVPYGRGSDFFFSGHSGFLVICACEWNKIKMPKVRNFVMMVALYTMLILLVYRIHYSIDIFTGVFFSEWCFGKVDLYISNIESIPRKIMLFAQQRFFLFDRSVKAITLDQVVQQEQEQEEEAQQP